jgi:N-6 DNA methylase
VPTITAHGPLTAASLAPHLRRCGFTDSLLQTGKRYAGRDDVALVSFAHRPFDAVSACIAVADVADSPDELMAQCLELGAPVVFICHGGQLQWWRQRGQAAAELLETVPEAKVSAFFQEHRSDFRPNRIYWAKTRGLFEKDYQLRFVDKGLMPLVSQEVGDRLADLVTRVTSSLIASLPNTDLRWILRVVLRLLAAKLLKDKRAPRFVDLNLLDTTEVLSRTTHHYKPGEPLRVPRRSQGAVRRAAEHVREFAHLGYATTEALGDVYETALVSRDLRKQLGIHSTPSYLADYIVWKLAPWIGEIPEDRRHVFEPCCGNASFLVAALRLLRDSLGEGAHPRTRRAYLRGHLWGVDIDPFAAEMASLSLALADIPNPNGWNIEEADVFASDVLERRAAESMVLLANPPFENFDPAVRQTYAGGGHAPELTNKAAEIVRRTLPNLPSGAVFGLVMPRGFLHSPKYVRLRREVLQSCDLTPDHHDQDRTWTEPENSFC